MSTKILTAPNGVLIRADHIIAVSPLFQSLELGTDAFTVYTTGSSEPFLFAAPLDAEGARAATKRRKETAKAHADFIAAWEHALVDEPFFLPN